MKKRFNERSKVNFEFDFLKKENQLYEAHKDDLTVSLSAEARQQKAKEREDRKEQRKEKRKALLEASEPDPLLGEITVLVDSTDDLEVKEDEPSETEDSVTEKDSQDGEQKVADNADASDEESDDEEEAFVDFRLHESVRILSDLIDFNQQRLVAKQDKSNDTANNE